MGGGELPILSNIVKNNFITDNNFSPLKFKKIVNDELEINNLRLEFLKFLKYFKFDEKYITDKSPLNFRWIGFIKLIFPSAKIINCIRDPKNNCLSMFKNLFEGGLNFTYDQQDLVKYYKYYLDLMNFWESKFSNTIYNVKYENLISNSDHEIKKIINYCNLNWEKNCLSFYKNKTPIKTMSTAQARKPIYKTSINPFDKFKNYLKILDNEL
ncbi:sulfotransferase [Candidatus Pelagibacter sp.]|nr:sulfotransferase [Candidatus Pelagibacter sp.]